MGCQMGALTLSILPILPILSILLSILAILAIDALAMPQIATSSGSFVAGAYRAASINSMSFLSSSLTSWPTSMPRALARAAR